MNLQIALLLFSATLQRHYQEGDSVAYKMQGTNQGRLTTIRYEAQASGIVKKDPAGNFFEEFGWSELHVNGQPFILSPASQQFREALSQAPGFTLSIPDLSKVQPILIGPITDLLSFYADVQLAMRQDKLAHAGDHTYVNHNQPNSWADGTYVLVGQDAIDFDITLQSIDPATQVATLVVRHVPPAKPQIKFPAAWMLNPVSDGPNNWVEVEKGANGKITAEVGLETFEDTIKLSMATGRIISASMENPVEVQERDCDDSTLAVCGTPVRYRIHRKIELELKASE